MPPRRATQWAAIEAEFDEPIADVIMGLRELGNSWRTVAGALGVHYGTLQEWRKALGLPMDKANKVYDPSSYPEDNPTDRLAKRLGYESIVDAVTDMRIRQGLTLKEAGAVLGCHYQTISLYSPDEVKGTINLSDVGYRRRLQNLRKGTQASIEKRADSIHPWEADEDARRNAIQAARTNARI